MLTASSTLSSRLWRLNKVLDRALYTDQSNYRLLDRRTAPVSTAIGILKNTSKKKQKVKPITEQQLDNKLIANAINSISREIRLLTFGGASITENSHGVLEAMALTMSGNGKEVAAAIRDVAQSISEVADSIKLLSESISDGSSSQKLE